MAACNAFADDITRNRLLHPHELRSLVDNNEANNKLY